VDICFIDKQGIGINIEKKNYIHRQSWTNKWGNLRLDTATSFSFFSGSFCHRGAYSVFWVYFCRASRRLWFVLTLRADVEKICSV